MFPSWFIKRATKMYVLGIETSCDETSAAVVKDGREVLSNVVASSLAFHKKYGGVVPEIAFRKQLETIAQVADTAVRDARIRLEDVGAVSVTDQPGLFGSLLVGIVFAKAVSASTGVPLLGVHHLYSHMYASVLSAGGIRLPFVALIVSGGHTSLFYVEDFDRIKLLGATLDDACGEAFDKVAKILGLGYPGGPLIEQRAKKGDPAKIKFGCSVTKEPLDFSFSGIKTAVLYYVKKQPMGRELVNDICASFQESVVKVLIHKTLLAVKAKKVKRIVVGGGVAANNYLRGRFSRAAEENGVSVYFPSKPLCMDNAAMVAGLG